MHIGSIKTMKLISGVLVLMAISCRSFALPADSNLCHTDFTSQTNAVAPESLNAYAKVGDYNELMFLYYSTALRDPDYDTMANVFSKEYRLETNTFRRAKLLEKLKPSLDAGICAADRSQYFTVSLPPNTVFFSHYDLSKKSFGLPLIDYPCTVTVSTLATFCRRDKDAIGFYDLQFTNTKAFDPFPVSDQAIAETIEDLISNKTPPRLQIYAVTEDTSKIQPAFNVVQVIRSRITAVQLIDQKGHVLTTLMDPSATSR